MKILSRKNFITTGDKKIIRGWLFFDWANSVFPLTISSTIFPVYYNTITTCGTNDVISFFGFKIINTVIYSWTIAFASLIIAIFSPLFSSIADYTGRRKLFMRIFTLIGALSCGLLFFFTRDHIEFGIIAFLLGSIGYGGSIVFYNSFLPVIAEPKDQDRISANGFAMGYSGAILLLIIDLSMVIKPEWFGMTKGLMPARVSFITVCVWWLAFSQITFSRLPKFTFGNRKKGESVLLKGYSELQKVMNQIKQMPHLTIYLFGAFFMMTGLHAVLYMAATYGNKELKLSNSILIGTILCIQLVGIGGAFLFAKLSEWFGNIRALIIAVIFWIIVVIGAYYITDATGFIIVALCVGIVMGGTQALARSTYSKMLPETKDHTSFFSFYDVMEKLSIVLGTFSFGVIEVITGSMRHSVLAIILFFITGLFFLGYLNKKMIKV